MKRWLTRLVPFASPHWRGLCGVLLWLSAGVAMDLLKPWPMKLIVDHVLTDRPLPGGVAWLALLPGADGSSGLLAWLAGATVLLFLGAGLAQIARAALQSNVGNRMARDLGAAVFDHVQRLSLTFHARRATGDLVRRVTTDSFCIRDMAVGVIIPLVTSVVSLLAMFMVMWTLNPVLSVLAMGVVLPLGIVIRLFSGPMTRRTYEQQQLEGQMLAMAETTLTALPVVQAFNREDYEYQRFRTLTNQTLLAYLKALGSQLAFKVSTSSVMALGTAGMIALGGYHVLDGKLTLGGLLVFLSYLASLYAPLESMAYLAAGFADAAGKAQRTLEVLDADDAIRDAPDAKLLPAQPRGQTGFIRLENVTFGYERGRAVLQDVSLHARPGEVVALVGSTGAGKSTLVSLIPRLFDPWKGRVTFDGHDVRGITLTSLREKIAVLLQEPFLLPLTVAENIAYGSPSAGRDALVAAAIAASADPFIRQLPQGYDTPIGERGMTLSGGQKQRIAIARALLKDAPVLILDEPTSALDVETESLLIAALEQLIQNRTTFIIAHRLSTIRRADRIVVLEHGRIIETGTHTELMAMQKRYYQLQQASVRTD